MKINNTEFILFLLILMASLTTSQAQISEDGLLPEANRDFQFDYDEISPLTFASFEDVATWADVVAIAQVVNIDYIKTRELNAMGQAFLTVRVPYKGVKKNQLLTISSKGFEDHVCYYPDRIDEGERFLVFLKKTKNEGEYQGFNPYCQLQVLLTETGQYALRYPLNLDFELSTELVQNMKFVDPHATVDATEWTGLRRQEHQDKFNSILSEESDMFQKYFYLTYTQAIMIYEIRKLMNIPTQQRINSKQM